MLLDAADWHLLLHFLVNGYSIQPVRRLSQEQFQVWLANVLARIYMNRLTVGYSVGMSHLNRSCLSFMKSIAYSEQ